MISRLLDALNQVGLNPNGEEIADILWLTLQMRISEPDRVHQDQVNQPDSQDASSSDNLVSNPKILPPQPQPQKRTSAPVKKTTPSAPLYTNDIGTPSGEQGSLTFKAPSAVSLQEPLQLGKALRPLMRRVLSRTETVLDEVATAERIAEEKILVPVLKPAPERWFDLALIADESPSMGIWRRTVVELQRLLERHGAFRNVQACGLLTNEKGQIRLRSGIGAAARSRRLHSPNELVDPSGQRLFLVVSDCVSSMWRDGTVTEALTPWVKSGPLAIVQMLPEQLWERTALGLSAAVQLRSLTPGTPNQKLIAEGIASWDVVDLESGLKVPVVTLEPEPLSTWAQMVVGTGGAKTAGFIIELPRAVGSQNNIAQEEQSSLNLSAEQRIHRFLNAASPIARSLAGLLAAAPVISLPILRLIQRTMLEQSRQVHVAEVFLGGILKPESSIDIHTDPDYVQYGFVDEKIRSILLDAIPLSSSTKVLHEVSDFVAKRAGLSLQEFMAILQDPTLPRTEAISDRVRPFALVTAQVLKRLGGEYIHVAERLEQQFNEPQEVIDVESAPQLYALLIGIDYYLPNNLPDGSSYKSLRACVRDVALVKEFLQSQLRVPEECILQLTSSNTEGRTQPPEPPEYWPTYENIVAAFKQLTEKAQPGDQVYIYYCGHGGRTRTIYPNLKGEDGIDTVLVPVDIGAPQSRYIRDLEFELILKKMVDKGLIVTVVLDCSHAGGMNRGNTDARVPDIIETTPRPTDSLVEPNNELVANRINLTPGRIDSSWSPSSRNYVMLAACQPNEYAYEYGFNGKERNGALTYWFVDSLRVMDTAITYKQLFDRIVAKVHSKFPNQTPQLYGEGDRIVFGSDRISTQDAVIVMQVDGEQKQVTLNAGLAQGLSSGTRFAIYPLNTTNFSNKQLRLAIIEVMDVEASSAVARVLEEADGGIGVKGQIEQGAPAVILSRPVNRVRRVHLFDRKKLGDAENELPTQELVNQQKEALDKVRQALAENGWVVEVQGEEESHYQVAIGRRGEYEICIGMPIKNLNPALLIGDPEAPREVVNRLVHLAKYQAVQELDNPGSKLNDSLEFVLLDQNKQPLPDQSNITLKQGTPVYLRVKNTFLQALNVAVLDLEPTWEISQIPLQGIDAPFYQLASQETVDTRLRFKVPEGKEYEPAKETIKLFATHRSAGFRWLTLPSLDWKSEAHHEATRDLQSAFGKLQEAVGEDPNVSPSLNRGAVYEPDLNVSPSFNRKSSFVYEPDPNDEWVTKQIQITIEP